MKSDALFYQLFQTAPQIFFELISQTPHCSYRFTSITLKTAEKRLDGFFEPSQPGAPLYFVEVQAEKDPGIYWRTLTEIGLYFNQNPDQQDTPWFAVVIWFEKKKDPGFKHVPITTTNKTQRLISLQLPKILAKLPENSLALNVLRPFIVDSETKVRQNFKTWVQHIQQNQLDPAAQERLLEVLTQLIEQKFKNLSYEELAKMLNLTPFEETVSFKKAMHKNLQELLAKLLPQKFHLAEKTMSKLMARLRQLTLTDLTDLFEIILTFKTLKQLNTWIDDRLARQTTETTPLIDRRDLLELSN